MLYENLLIYIASFLGIWTGAGIIVSSIDRISKRIHLSPFIISFLALGILTSIPEFAVGVTAISKNTPEIFVGNLIGGVPVIFLFIIPILAIFGKGIKLHHQLSNRNMILSLLVAITPMFFILDNRITNIEGVLTVSFYLLTIFLIQRDNGMLKKENINSLNIRAYSLVDILKVAAGFGIVLISSHFIVNNTIYFSQFLNIPIFLTSLIFISIGTNLPELSIAARAIASGKKDIALGDYLGSAAANSLLFGLLTIANRADVIITTNFINTFIFILFGISLFYIFSRTNNDISRKEGLVLLSLYLVFVMLELFS